MRPLLGVLLAAPVMALAHWAYQENYRTQAALREMARLEAEIAARRGALAVLEVEWAYLNRPERLRDLARLNDARLGLVPLAGEAFGQLDQVPHPADLAAPGPGPSGPGPSELGTLASAPDRPVPEGGRP